MTQPVPACVDPLLTSVLVRNNVIYTLFHENVAAQLLHHLLLDALIRSHVF